MVGPSEATLAGNAPPDVSVWVSESDVPFTENNEIVPLPAFTATRFFPPFTRVRPPWEAKRSAVAVAALAPRPPVAYVPASETVPSVPRV
jgi:hypothetical protein